MITKNCALGQMKPCLALLLQCAVKVIRTSAWYRKGYNFIIHDSVLICTGKMFRICKGLYWDKLPFKPPIAGIHRDRMYGNKASLTLCGEEAAIQCEQLIGTDLLLRAAGNPFVVHRAIWTMCDGIYRSLCVQ
ncbi:hypothetical protein XELAEV_18044534mg [Xenopus laevis]|uniref:BTB domain-containing protein n=1 Tax=Xenopus laevis TaxID=8355 RepID=A0A974H3G1_XENLA|nr:hypothetical protein XELAEV_18044534mg [Xenopus laevis]